MDRQITDRVTDAQLAALTAELDNIADRSGNGALYYAIREITKDRSAVVELALLLKCHDTAGSAIVALLKRDA